jgi:hypothetical protein
MATDRQKDFGVVSPDQQLLFFGLDVRNAISSTELLQLLNSCNSRLRMQIELSAEKCKSFVGQA